MWMRGLLKIIILFCLFVAIIALPVESTSNQVNEPLMNIPFSNTNMESLNPIFSQQSLPPEPVENLPESIGGSLHAIGIGSVALSDRTAATQLSLLSYRFIPNAGQVDDPQVKFIVKATGSSLFFSPMRYSSQQRSGKKGTRLPR